MNKFLNKLKKDGKLELADPSDEICNSYLEKAENCLASAKLLLDNDLYENSVSMSYYAMYDSLLAFLFKTGIKSENHSASILLLKLLFNQQRLFKIISGAKEERIDSQYYVATENFDLTKESAKELFIGAEKFILEIKLLIKNIPNNQVNNLKEKFNDLMGDKDE